MTALAVRLFDARGLAEQLRCATNHELIDFLDALDSGTREIITDRLHPLDQFDADAAEEEIAGLETDNLRLEKEVERLEDRVAELEESPADCILLAWDLSKHKELPDLKRARNDDLRDQLAAFSQFISRAYLVAPKQEPSRGR